MRTEATFSRCTRLVLNSLLTSLRSRRLEVVGTRKNGRARRRHPLRVSSRAPVLSFARYFQAPATQATFSPAVFFCVCLHAMLHVLRSPLIVGILHFFAMIVTEGTPVRPRTRIYCLCPANC